MPRTPLPPQSVYPLHIGARSINQEWFDLPMPLVWDIFENQLYFLHNAFGVKIHAFVLMNNHFHLIVSTPRANLAEAMAFFMRESSREIVRKSGRINQTWGGPFFRCLLKTNSHFLNAYKYVYRNPVAAGLARQCEEYRFSTLHGLLGQSTLIIPMENDTLLFTPDLDLEHLNWLNTGKPEDEAEVRKALRKNTFAFQKLNKYQTREDTFVY